MRVTLPFLLIAALLAANSATAAPAVSIGPHPFSDRQFPYVEEGPVFNGIPLEVAHARLPGAVIVIAAADAAKLAAQAGKIAFMLGQLAQSPAVGRHEIMSRQFTPLVMSDREITPAIKTGRNLILLGVKNPLMDELKPKLPARFGVEGPALYVVADAFAPGKHVMAVTGPTDDDMLAASDYLAYDRLLHRSGAYDGLFGFVRLRTYLEKRNFRAASDLLDDPQQLRACAKSVTVMMPRQAQMPAGVPEMSMKRNTLVFKHLREAISREDQPGAIGYWKQTMETCYACHAGRGGKQVVMFKPARYPHRLHQGIAAGANLECTSCHQGSTEALGYAN